MIEKKRAARLWDHLCSLAIGSLFLLTKFLPLQHPNHPTHFSLTTRQLPGLHELANETISYTPFGIQGKGTKSVSLHLYCFETIFTAKWLTFHCFLSTKSPQDVRLRLGANTVISLNSTAADTAVTLDTSAQSTVSKGRP